MGKILTREEIQNLALELAGNKHFIERLDDYEKQKIKKEIDFEIGLYDWEVNAGIKNISQDRIDKIESYKRAKRWLKMNEVLKGLKVIIENESESDNNEIYSAPVLGKLLALDAPKTRLNEIDAWLIKLGMDPAAAGKKARSVYNVCTSVRDYKDRFMIESVVHLEKLVKLIEFNPQFKKHLSAVNNYLKTANAAKKTKTK